VSLAGTLLGFAGIAALTLPGSRSASVELWGMLLIVAGTLGWATGSFISPRLGLPGNPFVTAVWEMLLGGAAMVVIGSAGVSCAASASARSRRRAGSRWPISP
jgi:drug/metabolite transporter (DMT)-like permease